jgi:hypothetical protein
LIDSKERGRDEKRERESERGREQRERERLGEIRFFYTRKQLQNA